MTNLVTHSSSHLPHEFGSEGADAFDGLYTRDARGWVVMKHLAQLMFCALAVTLAINTTISIAVAIAWGLTGLVLISVMVAADRARFIESGFVYERARFSVIEPPVFSVIEPPLQHQYPFSRGGSPYEVTHGPGPAVPSSTTSQPQAPFQVTVT